MINLINGASAKVWKMRYAFEFHRRTGFAWTESWAAAGSSLEDMLEGDFTEMEPADAVSEELSCWTDGHDDV